MLIADRDEILALARTMHRALCQRREETGEEVALMAVLVLPGGGFAHLPLSELSTRELQRAAARKVAQRLGAVACLVFNEVWACIPETEDEARQAMALRSQGVAVPDLPGAAEVIMCTIEHPLGIGMLQSKVIDGKVGEPTLLYWDDALEGDDAQGALVNMSGLVVSGPGSPRGVVPYAVDEA